jgi:hypothetical protein
MFALEGTNVISHPTASSGVWFLGAGAGAGLWGGYGVTGERPSWNSVPGGWPGTGLILLNGFGAV